MVSNLKGSAMQTMNFGIELSDEFEDGLARVRDVDIGRRLGMAQPLDIRRTIEKYSQDLNDFGVLAHRAKTSGARGGRPAIEYWLNKDQAIYIAGRSDTEVGRTTYKLLVKAFGAFERMASQPVLTTRQDPQTVALLQTVVETQNSMVVLVRSIDQRVTQIERGNPGGGSISAQTWTRIRAIVRKIAEKEALTKRQPSKAAATRDVYRDIGEITGWGGKAQKWADLPAHCESPVMVHLTRRLMDAERHADRLLARQIDMFSKLDPEPN